MEAPPKTKGNTFFYCIGPHSVRQLLRGVPRRPHRQEELPEPDEDVLPGAEPGAAGEAHLQHVRREPRRPHQLRRVHGGHVRHVQRHARGELQAGARFNSKKIASVLSLKMAWILTWDSPHRKNWGKLVVYTWNWIKKEYQDIFTSGLALASARLYLTPPQSKGWGRMGVRIL